MNKKEHDKNEINYKSAKKLYIKCATCKWYKLCGQGERCVRNSMMKKERNCNKNS